MSTSFDLVVYGVPVPQGSKSVTKRGRMYEANKNTKPWREQVKAAAEQHLAMLENWVMLDGPLVVRLVFWMPRPRSHYGTGRNADHVKDSAPLYPHSKPDIDKLTRAIFDAMTMARVWSDDSRVVNLEATKRYAQTPDHACFAIGVDMLR